MNTPTAQIQRHQPGLRPERTLRFQADTAPARLQPHASRPALAGHDFLVPNPRPDLTLDPNTLRMLEAG
jgi:hypothetical protein